MTPPVWKVIYCGDFNRLYDSWLLLVEDPAKQKEASTVWDEMTKHKAECTRCVREPNTQY